MKRLRSFLDNLSDGGLSVLYAAVIYAVLWTIVGIASSMGGAISRVQFAVAIVLPPVLGLAAAYTQRLASDVWGALLGMGGGHARNDPPLSRVRSLIQQERWDDACAELDEVWARFPGHPDVLTAFERCYLDGLHAPSGFAEFLRAAIPLLAGEDRAYAYWRLAELNVDVFGQPMDARLWCRRIETEFPGSPRLAQARALLERLPATADP